MNTAPEKTFELIDEPSIGAKLSAARKSKGISFNKASNITKLKVTYLEALEENKFELLPAPIYAKNFIKIYGNFLGLDGEELSKNFGKKTKEVKVILESEKPKPSYHISILFNAITKNLFLVATVVACIVLFFVVFKKPKEIEKFDVKKDKQPENFVVELENYTPVYDSEESLPIVAP